MNAMPEERPRSRKTALALAIAHGTSVTASARQPGIQADGLQVVPRAQGPGRD
jgi:hypothetical protein